ncbi:hypothetical protein [Kineococcus terrestris]|uniref:hypothetical protein n=1 Tax=Kineococcus terrestris TaxID=2044856 RepID=UPI0034DABE61
MPFDPNTFVVLGGAIATVLGGVGAVLAGLNKYLRDRIVSLEADLNGQRAEQTRDLAVWEKERTRLETALEVSRRETDVARAKQDEIRRDKDSEIERITAARRADRLQHEAEMQARVRELGGGLP